MTKRQSAEQEEARTTLRALCPPGTTVYTVLRHVSRSGMSRLIDCYVMQNGEPRWISSLVGKVGSYPFDRKREALRVGGRRANAGFAVVNNLSYYLYPDGFGCTGERCPSNDHANGDRDRTPHCSRSEEHWWCDANEIAEPPPGIHWCRGRNHWHTSGDYALTHRWL